MIQGISRSKPDAVISIDTRRRTVAEAAVAAGAQISSTTCRASGTIPR